MWKKVVPLLVILSVALNIAFIGVWIVHAVRTHWLVSESSDSEVWCPLHRKLNVTDEQWQRIEPHIAEFRRRAQVIHAEMNRSRAELIDLIASDEPDRQAITAKEEKIRAGQQRMQQLVVDHLLAEKQVLTAEQQKKFFELILDDPRGSGGCTGRWFGCGPGQGKDGRTFDNPDIGH